MPELQAQVDTVREAFSANVQKAFVLKPSFPYSSPQPSTLSSPPHPSQGYQQVIGRTGSLDQHLDAKHAPHNPYANQPITPPISTGPMGSKNESPAMQSLDLIPQSAQMHALSQNLAMPEQSVWNPSKIFE